MMNITLIDKESTCRMIFAGSLTIDCAREMEDRILDALRRHTCFEVDLSRVEEIDLCGIHLLGVLDAVAGESVKVVGSSPAVRRAYEKMAPRRGTWLRGSREERVAVAA